MTKENYLKMTQPFRENPKMAKSLHICNRILTGMIFVGYPLLLLWLLKERRPELARAVIIPMDGVIIVSVLRCFINRPRPYEKFAVAPVIPKETKGKSCPSRHVFSAAVIAMTFISIPDMAAIGIILLVFAVLIGIIRVVSGVHFISDVIAALLCALICIALAGPLGL